jgi:hypothetical protein
MNESAIDDLKKLRRLAKVNGNSWSIELRSETEVVVVFTKRRGQEIAPISALLTTDEAYPVQPTGVKFLDPTSGLPSGALGWPNDQNAMFKTDASWQPGPFICMPGIREYHSYPGHNQEPIDPSKARLPSICSRIQHGIDSDSFQGRIE